MRRSLPRPSNHVSRADDSMHWIECDLGGSRFEAVKMTLRFPATVIDATVWVRHTFPCEAHSAMRLDWSLRDAVMSAAPERGFQARGPTTIANRSQSRSESWHSHPAVLEFCGKGDASATGMCHLGKRRWPGRHGWEDVASMEMRILPGERSHRWTHTLKLAVWT